MASILTTIDNLSITTALAHAEDNNYRPAPPPAEEDSLPLSVAAEIMCDARTQRVDRVLIAKTARWEEVKACLERSREGSWQVQAIEEEEVKDGGSGEAGKMAWMYQHVIKGIPGKEFWPLRTAKQWRKLRDQMVGEGLRAVIWPVCLLSCLLSTLLSSSPFLGPSIV